MYNRGGYCGHAIFVYVCVCVGLRLSALYNNKLRYRITKLGTVLDLLALAAAVLFVRKGQMSRPPDHDKLSKSVLARGLAAGVVCISDRPE